MKLGNPLSREIVATEEGKIYTYRGTEEPSDRNQEHNMWVYDMKTDEMKMTDYKITEGFWNGQATTRDGKKIYVSTSNGELYVLNTETGKIDRLTHFLPKENYENNERIQYFYSITLSKDEKSIYAIPSNTLGNLYEYNIEKKSVTLVKKLEDAIYTGNNIKDSKGNLYFGNFKAWEGKCRLLVINNTNK